MTAAASRYQTLRSHLHYLRLEAAAEALPQELEQARREKLSHTAFLERLLQIEVDATEARRLAGRLRFASLPAPWTLADFDFDAQPSLDRKLVDELASLRFLEDATNILLVGPPGSARRCSRSASPGKRSRPATASTTPAPPTSPPAATAPPSRAAGRP
jgi:DNA replication protein DnaC